MIFNTIKNTATQIVAAYNDYKKADSEESKARQKLVDLAGNEAVDKLDEDLKVESM